jgi:hypothetical protein
LPFAIVCQFGGPSIEISSVGSVATTIAGGFLSLGDSDAACVGMSFAIASGGFWIVAQGPFGFSALYQYCPPLK